MSQTQTKLKQKILLVALGVFLTLVFLEAALSFGGWLLTFFPEMKNHAQFDKAEIRILCIGESTTFLGGKYSYPAQLEEILNSRGEKKHFKVINKGLVAKTSVEILAQLDANLDKYKPDVVISMLGVNDYTVADRQNKFSAGLENSLDRFKTYRLFELIVEHGKAKFGRPSKAGSPGTKKETAELDDKFLSMGVGLGDVINNDVGTLTARLSELEHRFVRDAEVLKDLKSLEEIQDMKKEMVYIKKKETWLLIFIGKQHRINKNYQEAERNLARAILSDDKHAGAYAEMGSLYQDQGKHDVAIEFFKKALEIEPDNVSALVGLARSCAALGMEKETRLIAQRLFNNDKGNLWIYPEFGIWFKEHGYFAEAEKFFERALAAEFRDDRIYPNLAEVYRSQGKSDKLAALEQRTKSDQKKETQFLPMTIFNYNEIADRVLSRNVKFICMQYPLRDIEPLKAIFRSPRGIVFVDNKTNFQKALQGSYYSDLFMDSFAGDFGHCTRIGNRLIAGNLAEVIFKEIPEE